MEVHQSVWTASKGIGLTAQAFEALDFLFRSQPEHDMGIDAHAEVVENGRASGRLLGLQIKAGESYLSETQDDSYVFRPSSDHVSYWIQHALPVLICLCDLETKRVYWQITNQETAISTRKGFKIKVPKGQKVDIDSQAALRDILTPIVSTQRYTLVKTEDVSHAGAKRYAFRVVLNGPAPATKADIAAIVRQVTREGKRRRYHRNSLAQQHWGHSDAHVVWGFIYLTTEDEKRDLPICRSLWIHESLPENARPARFKGENVGDSIIVEWDSNNAFFSQLFAKEAVTKEEYLSRVHSPLHELKERFTTVQGHLHQLSRSEMTESEFLARTHKSRERIDKIDLQIGRLPIAPFECIEVDAVLKEFVAFVSNIALYYSERDQNPRSARIRLIESGRQVEYANQTLQKVEFEMDKAL